MTARVLVLLILVCCICTGLAAAKNVTASVGETWVRWQWTTPEPVVNIYVDGTLKEINTTRTFYYVQNAEPLEKHNIQLYNASNGSQKLEDSTVTTLYPKGNIFFMLGVIVALGIILLLAKDQIKIILIGVVAIALSLYTSGISTGYEGLYLLPMIMAILIGAYLTITLWEVVRGKAAWY